MAASPLAETRKVLADCCTRLGVQTRGLVKIIHGSGSCAATLGARVRDWSGLGPTGAVTQYQLVL
eukprot:5252146-Amphidinium_carterae.1